MSWVLIIWVAGGDYDNPTIPVRVDKYLSEAACQKAMEAWKTLGPKHPYKGGACLPGGN